ncbi:MAG TPA: hypothetical protein VGA75_13715 [Paracoccaceae bacterium]
MPKYAFIYHGGKKPESPEAMEKVMAAWTAWFASMGPAVVDGGGPVGLSHTVTKAGVIENGGANPASGWSVVSAESQAAATTLAKACPILDDGGSVEVAEVMAM